MRMCWKSTGTWEVFGKLRHAALLMCNAIPNIVRRIEDNILITKTGFENLTLAIKDPAEIERIMASN